MPGTATSLSPPGGLTCAGDIGLKVEDAAATVERARALGAGLFEQPVGAGELKIPAIRSQAVETADGAMRITLNGAESQHTLADHFIAQNFGSAVHHVAFLSRDIFASAQALTADGFKLLVLSKNYYDDLAARFDLDQAFIDRLSANNILYDRDDHGEFFQLYRSNFGEGFFFEIVERRGGYNGYGAANAQFRIAAQKRALRPKEMPRY